MKLLMGHPVPFVAGVADFYYDALRKNFEAMIRDGTTVDFFWPKKGYSDSTRSWTETYNAMESIKGYYEASKAGYDGIVITGKADNLVYLKIVDDAVSIEDATAIAGSDTYEIESLLRKQCGGKVKVTAIGKAGEHLVKFACVMNDGPAGRAAAR